MNKVGKTTLWRKWVIVLASLIVCIGMNASQAFASGVDTTGNNFSMVEPGDFVTMGGTNDVRFTWDGTTRTSVAVSGQVSNATLSSPSAFNGFTWVAHDVVIYGPGPSYAVFDGCPAGSPGCGTGNEVDFTVGPNELGAHMLFDWGAAAATTCGRTNCNIDVVNVWTKNAVFGPSTMWTAGGGSAGTVWNWMSKDVDGDGANGLAMSDGAFTGFAANFNVMGTPTTGVISTSTNPLAFGSIQTGTTKDLNEVITNISYASLIIGTVTAPAAPFTIAGDTCSGNTLASQATCTVTVHFAPLTDGPHNDSFSIPSNDPSSPKTVNVSGTASAVPVPHIVVTPASLVSFGSVTQGSSSSPQTVTISNDGNASLSVTSIQLGGTNPTNFTLALGGSNPCPNLTPTIASGNNCTVTVVFNPLSSGAKSATLTISSNDPSSATSTVNLSGAGLALPLPKIGVAPNPVAFGAITSGISSSMTITVANSGNANLIIGSIASGDPVSAPFSITADGCSGMSVAPAGTCTLTVRFAPNTAGSVSDSFDIPSNDAVTGTVTVSLNGTGLSADSVDTSGNNFTMIDPKGAIVGGTNDVRFTWDKTLRSSIAESGQISNATLSSVTPFFGNLWSAHDVTIYGPGTYTVYSKCPAKSPGCGDSDEKHPAITFTVATGELGAHMLFDWGGSTDIDVIDVWTPSAIFGPSPMWTGAGGSNSEKAVWDWMSKDWDGDGINGRPMVDGPFIGFNANFNVMVVPNNPPSKPMLKYPEDGAVGMDTSFVFRWEKAIDPDQKDMVKYTISYSTTTNFIDTDGHTVADAGQNSKGMFFAGGAGMLMIGMTFIGGFSGRKRMIAILLVISLFSGGALISCGNSKTAGGGKYLSIDEKSYTVSGLMPNTTYYWKVVATDGKASVESDVRSFTTK